MSTSLVVLTAQHVALGPSSAYATRLARAMGVPLRLLPPHLTEALTSGAGGLGPHEPLQAGMPRPGTPAAILAAQNALLLVLPRPTIAEARPGWLATLAGALLQSTTQPLLIVPPQPQGEVPPLRMVLAASGEPFQLVHGRRAMHALLFTLPIHLKVVHVQLPGQAPNGTEALQSVLTCGLATRSVATELLEVAADNAAEGILLGLAQASADLLVLIVRQRSLREGRFAQSIPAALLQRSPVPVLLLVAADGA